MRSVWNGSIAFGTVSVPVRVYGATEVHGPGLHQVHAVDGGRIRLRRTCEVDGAEVAADEVAKGVTLPGGDVVTLTDGDLASLPVPTAHEIEVCAFTPLEQVDPIYLGRSYYLEPDPVGVRAYVLFTEALRQSGQVAVVKVALRQRESLALLRVRDQVLVMSLMLWPDEIRTPEFPFLDQDVPVRLADVRAARKRIERLSGDFAPGRYRDGYREALTALVDAKVHAHRTLRPTAITQDETADDLLTALDDTPSVEPEPTEVPEPRDSAAAAVEEARAAARRAAAAKAAATRAAKRARATT
jgi:DNA end-binding protein Ku